MKFKKLYEKYISPKERAGLIPYYEDDGKILIALMIPSDPKYGGSDIQIAKGGIDSGYTALETAKKEGKEELGYPHQNHYKIQLLWNNKKMGMQYFFVKVDNMDFAPPHYETKEVVWVELNRAEKTIRSFQRQVISILKRKLGYK